MCRNAMFNQKSHWVCLPCRFSAKHSSPTRCPLCRTDMVDLGPDFRPPRKGNSNQWRKVELLVEAGVRFGSCCDHGYCPQTLAEAKADVVMAGRPELPKYRAYGKYDHFLARLAGR
jgi:hypothetical protein